MSDHSAADDTDDALLKAVFAVPRPASQDGEEFDLPTGLGRFTTWLAEQRDEIVPQHPASSDADVKVEPPASRPAKTTRPIPRSEKTHRDLLARIPAATGKSLDTWFQLIDQGPSLTSFEERVNWLRTEHSVPRGYANAIVNEMARQRRSLDANPPR